MEVVYKADGSAKLIEEHELTTECVETLLTLAKKGWWEFRDYGEKDFCSEGILKASNCDYLETIGLLNNGDGMDWHTTFYITKKGQKFIECLNILQ